MITCQHARQLFDGYLDGELSPCLQAELHAHQLSCSACQSELAMLEACGDVILLDRRREPQLSASFTDRVLLARRAQLVRRERSWGRTLVVMASPVAAAASILLALTLITPPDQQKSPTKVAGTKARVANPVANTLVGENRRLSDKARQEWQDTPTMPSAGYMERTLAAGTERSQRAADRVRGGLGHLSALFGEALARTRESLEAGSSSVSDRGSNVFGQPHDVRFLSEELWRPLDPALKAPSEPESKMVLPAF